VHHLEEQREEVTGAFRFKLSKGSLLLLHLAAAGHVWRDEQRQWVASTLHTKRNVDIRIKKMIDQGVLEATFETSFPKVTPLGQRYMQLHPVQDALQEKIIR
jgi:hypothetical protein